MHIYLQISSVFFTLFQFMTSIMFPYSLLFTASLAFRSFIKMVRSFHRHFAMLDCSLSLDWSLSSSLQSLVGAKHLIIFVVASYLFVMRMQWWFCVHDILALNMHFLILWTAREQHFNCVENFLLHDCCSLFQVCYIPSHRWTTAS